MPVPVSRFQDCRRCRIAAGAAGQDWIVQNADAAGYCHAGLPGARCCQASAAGRPGLAEANAGKTDQAPVGLNGRQRAALCRRPERHAR